MSPWDFPNGMSTALMENAQKRGRAGRRRGNQELERPAEGTTNMPKGMFQDASLG
jgi:hypothetical protein